MRYVLNSAVITSAGVYEYRLIKPDHVRHWLLCAPYTSTVGYAETAEALSTLTGEAVPVDRKIIRMAPGDEALVFRLVQPEGQRRLAPGAKGQVGQDYIRQHCEAGILVRIA